MAEPIQRQIEIFGAALELPAGAEREAYLQQACGDAASRRRIEALLRAHEAVGESANVEDHAPASIAFEGDPALGAIVLAESGDIEPA